MEDGIKSSWHSVTKSVPQGSEFGPVLFNVFVNYFDVAIKGSLGRFADDTKLSVSVELLVGRNALPLEEEALR